MSPANGSNRASEQTPLLQNNDGSHEEENDTAKPTEINFEDDDEENPRNWPKRRKMLNVLIIALMAILSPLASSMFTPGIDDIAESFGKQKEQVILALTSFTFMLGIGPLILAPLSETYGRKKLYMICFSTFALLQIPTALSPNLACLIVCRAFAGFFGSVGIANGGGSLGDMFAPAERAGVFGWYLLGPLLGPSIGPLLGSAILQFLPSTSIAPWRFIFWFLAAVSTLNVLLGYFFLKETYAPIILLERSQRLEKEKGGKYTFEGHDDRPVWTKLRSNIKRPVIILFTQPIVFVMATYQAVLFATMYSLFTSMEPLYGKDSQHGLNTIQVGLLYLGPGLGFLLAVWFLVPKIDVVFNRMAEKHDGPQPEYRLPLANVGSVLLPSSLLVFAFTVQQPHCHWGFSIAATVFFGFGQVSIFNTVQNYYIDAFSKYAASAIAAGTVFRSIIGGIVPLFIPTLYESIGVKWTWTGFALLTLLLSPSPLVFQKFGRKIREKYALPSLS